MIEVSNLRKEFDSLIAVRDLSFSVSKGEVLGFLGPNGAGKSTTMKMITCFLTPTSGTTLVCGHSIQTESVQVRRSIGYMPENAPLYGDQSVLDFLNFICEIREIPVKERSEKINRVLQLCALEEMKNKIIETLSKGYKRRVSFAQALIHDPEVLIS